MTHNLVMVKNNKKIHTSANGRNNNLRLSATMSWDIHSQYTTT